MLQVKHLKIHFRTANGEVQAVRDISFNLQPGRTLAIVGESGSGKSVTSKAIMGILPGNARILGGEILYRGQDLLQRSEKELCRIRGDEIAMIFQDPMSSLNPIMPIGKQITEAMLLKNKAARASARRQLKLRQKQIRRGLRKKLDSAAAAALDRELAELTQRANRVLTRAMARKTALELMAEVGIPDPPKRYRQYPFEFSGGMRQRIVIAIALAAQPKILICDEPTTALDVTIQAQILDLIDRLKENHHLSVIFITHDLGVVARMADEIGVMYAGQMVEYGTAEDIFYDPRHPYTWALLSSMPDLETRQTLESIPGTPPNMIHPPQGDAFARRSRYAMEIDFQQQPPAFAVSPTHWAATWLLHPDAPKAPLPESVARRIRRKDGEGI